MKRGIPVHAVNPDQQQTNSASLFRTNHDDKLQSCSNIKKRWTAIGGQPKVTTKNRLGKQLKSYDVHLVQALVVLVSL